MSRPEHVLMTADAVGGVWTFALELSRALTTRGTAVSLATMGGPLRDEQREQARQIEGLEVFESTYKLEWMQDPWRDVAAASDWLLNLESRLQPELVHLNGYVHGALDWKTPCAVVAHSCVYSWWNGVHGYDPPSSWLEYKQRITAGLHGADVVAAVSAFMKNALALHYGFPDAAVIHNGASPLDYVRGDKQPLILASGRVWDSAKNLGSLAPLQFDWPLYIAGELEHPDGGNPTLMGPRNIGRQDSEQMKAWLARAAIYISPARYEPFGLSVLEAALSGCALVLSNIPAFRELWDGAALFVSPDDPKEFASEVNSLAKDARLRRDYAARAMKRAAKYRVEQMVERYLELYAEARSNADRNHEAGASCVS
jgi:glycosyltransferase involved in cell wall biosynthesis